MDEVLADAAAGAQQVGDGRADVGDPAAVLEALGDQLAQRVDRLQRPGEIAQREQLGERPVGRLGDAREQVLAGSLEVCGCRHRLPCGVGRIRRIGCHDARQHVDRQRAVGPEMPNSITSVPK